jgi:hypothetical protein
VWGTKSTPNEQVDLPNMYDIRRTRGKQNQLQGLGGDEVNYLIGKNGGMVDDIIGHT